MTTCRHIARDLPRIVTGRHDPDCYDQTCEGCQPCTEPHCRICGREHADGSCAECTAATRDDLHEIGRLCHSLPEEVEVRGIDGEAMVLLGPAVDPEAWSHVEAAYVSGRLPEGWIEAAHGRECPLLVNEACSGCAGGELHPQLVLGTWDMVWRDALDHDEPTARLTIPAAIDYLDRQLTYMAGFVHVPFEDFARDLRACRAHLEAVLHDGEQRDTGAPCMACGVRQVREWGRLAAADGWRCPKCKAFSTEAQYALAVRADYEDQRGQFDYLPAEDCAAVTGATRGSITGWASRGQVRKRREYGRVVYHVADVRDTLDGRVRASGA